MARDVWALLVIIGSCVMFVWAGFWDMSNSINTSTQSNRSVVIQLSPRLNQTELEDALNRRIQTQQEQESQEQERTKAEAQRLNQIRIQRSADMQPLIDHYRIFEGTFRARDIAVYLPGLEDDPIRQEILAIALDLRGEFLLIGEVSISVYEALIEGYFCEVNYSSHPHRHSLGESESVRISIESKYDEGLKSQPPKETNNVLRSVLISFFIGFMMVAGVALHDVAEKYK